MLEPKMRNIHQYVFSISTVKLKKKITYLVCKFSKTPLLFHFSKEITTPLLTHPQDVLHTEKKGKFSRNDLKKKNQANFLEKTLSIYLFEKNITAGGLEHCKAIHAFL